MKGRDPDKGKWSLPGGSVESGEEILLAASRGAREETSHFFLHPLLIIPPLNHLHPPAIPPYASPPRDLDAIHSSQTADDVVYRGLLRPSRSRLTRHRGSLLGYDLLHPLRVQKPSPDSKDVGASFLLVVLLCFLFLPFCCL